MIIGYLHLGPPHHGIHRYGRLLATEAAQRSGITVLEAEVLLTDNPTDNRKHLITAAQQLSQADVIHIQFSKFNDRLWGKGWTQLDYLKLFLDHCSGAIVATLHDVFYAPPGIVGLRTQLIPALTHRRAVNEELIGSAKISRFKHMVREGREWWWNTFGSATAALQELADRTQVILVCSDTEAHRLGDRVNPEKLQMVPHFVESRSLPLTATEARQTLGLMQRRVITLLGFIYPAKGHQLLVEAIPNLPADVTVVFAGGADSDTTFVQTLQTIADTQGMSDRLRITGYLSESELEQYLLATDLAICPFREFSASGSISTWISVTCPIVAADLPQIQEYNALEPDAIATFAPYTATALATAIQHGLAQDPTIQREKMTRLRHQLSLSKILDHHLVVYRSQIPQSASTLVEA